MLTKKDFAYSSGSYTPYRIQIPPSTEVTYRFECMHFRDVDDNITPDCLFKFAIDGNGEKDEINGYRLNENILFYTGPSQNYSGEVEIGVSTLKSLGVDPNLHLGSNYDFRISISYTNPDDYSNLYGGGKRIKKIENIDEGGNSITKEYDYFFPADSDLGGGTNRPSGGIIGFPAFINKSNAGDGPFVNYTKYNDASSAYSSFQPNSIGYSSVIEYQGTKQNNLGKIEYTFTNLSGFWRRLL